MSLHKYYPQLKWKPAEYESLREIDQATLDGITPIIKVLDIDWDFENDCYKKTLPDYLIDFGSNLALSWSPERPILLDVSELDSHGTQHHHPLDMCVVSAKQHNKELIPVISPNYSHNYFQSVMRNKTNGVAVTVNFSNLHYLNQLVSDLDTPTNLVDIIIDLGDIQQVTDSLKQQTLQSCQFIINMAHWRNIILSSTCYPNSQAGIPQHQIYRLRREEWQLWIDIIQTGQLTFTPSFSDYPTASSTITSIDPRFMSQYAAVRYSNSDSWIFVKGTAVKGNGWGQTQNLCNILINSQFYYGQNFSWGDNYIFNRAHGINSSGGSKEWRKVAHTHHFTMVVQQLANYSVHYPARP